MIEKALFIVPHPDDELNIGGSFLYDLVQKSVDVYVIYTTNGDSNKENGNNRILQAYNSLESMGVKKQNIIFLGYPDGWNGTVHIYNSPPDLLMESESGKTITNCLNPYDEYCYRKNNIHKSFSRANLKADLKEAIAFVKAELICCVDFDIHPDHRAASLLTEEILGELLKENRNYRPVFLKKFAYEGVWTGKKDYYSNPKVETKKPREIFFSDSEHDTSSPCFTWNERLRFNVGEDNKQSFIINTPLFQAALKHKSTDAFFAMLGILNDDIVFWWRPTNNIMLNADITASSGETSFLNDFKRYDCPNVYNTKNPFEDESIGYWKADKSDANPIINIRFDKKQQVKELWLYGSSYQTSNITQFEVWAENVLIYAGSMVSGGVATKIVLEKEIVTSNIEFKIIQYIGTPTLGEIEIYSDEVEFPWNSIPVNKYDKNISNGSRINDKWLVYSMYIIKWKILNRVLGY